MLHPFFNPKISVAPFIPGRVLVSDDILLTFVLK